MNKKVIAISAVAIFFALLIVAVLIIFPGMDRASTSLQDEKGTRIVASFFPLADFSQNIGGSLVTVTTITPAGAEPHDYEPTPQDIAKMYNSQLFVYNGNGVDPWADKVRSDLENKGVTVIKMADYLDSLRSDASGNQEGLYDPHFWLSPLNAQKETDIIADALIKVDPAHESAYNQNRNSYKAQLKELDAQYQISLRSCNKHEIVTSHNAFNYLAARYGFNTLYILGLSPDGEASPQIIAQVTDLAKQKGIKYIFFESLVSPKLSQTIANEIGAQVLELNPIEGFTQEEISEGNNYLSQMRKNLTNLKIALECH